MNRTYMYDIIFTDLTDSDEHCKRFIDRCMPESFKKVCTLWLIDWCLTPTLEIFQLYHGIVHYKKKVLNINGQYNSTNMIKANEPLSSPQIIEHRKRSQNFPMENQVLAWDRHKHVTGLNQLIGSTPLNNWISNGNTNINKE